MEDNVLDGPYYFYSKNYLSLFGIWPLQSYKRKILFRVLMYLGNYSCLIPAICIAYELRNHFDYFLLSILSTMFYTQVLTKLSLMIISEDKFKKLIEQIKNDFKNYTGDNLRILNEYAEQARKVNRVYVFFLLSAVVLTNFTPFMPLLLDVLIPLNETRPRTLPRLMKYNIKPIENNFFVITLHGFLFNCLGILLILGFDTLLLNCAQHVCALFQIVIFVNDVESTYTVSNFALMGISLSFITLSQYETVKYIQDNRQMAFRFAIFACLELLHILFHNYPGQKIMDHSLMVYQSCYNSEWYRTGISEECKKLLRFMMLRSQRPSYLTGGGLYVLGLENFATILKASLSYFTFLTSV